MTNNGNGKITEKIRKLLALSSSPNEHEAALAAEKAQALLAEYNLSISDVVEKMEEDTIVDEAGETSSYPWRRNLAGMIGKLYFCQYMFVKFRKGRSTYDRHYFVGKPHNTAVCTMMFSYLSKTVYRLSNEGAKSVPKDQRSPYIVSFRNACTNRLNWRIHDRIEKAKKGGIVTESGKNLPALLDMYESAKKANDEFLQKRYGKELAVAKERKAKVLNYKGMIDGDDAGKSIGLDEQIDKKSTTLIGN